MSKNKNIEVHIFGLEIGKIGYDIDKRSSYFQYHPDFLDSGQFSRIFPYILKRIKPVQIFHDYEGETFRGLPPMFADSLPDRFGNIIFKKWWETLNRPAQKITPLEQLTYVGSRGMGALEYRPVAKLPQNTSINFEEIVDMLGRVLNSNKDTSEKELNDIFWHNIFSIGTSAGGVQPKILISQHKENGKLIPGDKEYSDAYHHYLVKLCLHPESERNYNEQKIEYAYARLAKKSGIQMMPTELMDDKHFATLRFERQNGEKQHVLTASGLTGWDFKRPEHSSYENLFKLAFDLKVPHRDLQQLFRRMVFNLTFANIDDHLKNHSFIYNKQTDAWNLAPAYDLTYPLNINNNYTKISRALSINGKRFDITIEDLKPIAEEFVIKNPKGIIQEVTQTIDIWDEITRPLDIPERVRQAIRKEFVKL